MHRIDTATKSVDKFGVGKHGFNDGNKAISVAATQLNANWCDAVQEEICNAIEGLNSVLDPADKAQLLGCLKAFKQLNIVKITSSGNFTTPANITADTVFKITLVGGGAGGGGGVSLGGGGGPGGCVEFFISGLSPSTAYAVVVGAAGTGGASPGPGGIGGTTQITINGTVYSVAGGIAGGGNAGPNNRTSGPGLPSATVLALPNLVYLPPAAPNGIVVSGVYAGPPGGSTPFGTGGNGGDSTGTASGSDGAGYGAGGGAGVGGNGGGNGTSGLFIAEWVA
jgi:hypothetical protein